MVGDWTILRYHYSIIGMIPIGLICACRMYYHAFDKSRHQNIE